MALTACGGGGSGADAATGTAGTNPVASTFAGTPGSQITQITPSATAATALEGLPAKILGCYFTAWDTTYRITDVPTDFNVIYLFNAQNGGNNSGDGSWTWPFASAVPAEQIQQVRQRGQKVILTIGGAGLGFAYTNRTQSTNCVNSVKSIISTIGGVDGVDFNNFEAGISNTISEMIWICQQLRDLYGPEFAITSPPAGFNTGGAPVAGIAAGQAADIDLMGALKDAGLLTYAAPQFYDWSFYKGTGVVSAITDQWVARLGADHVCVGLSAEYNFANALTLVECQREMSSILAAHPNIRGVFCWSAQFNMNGGNAWGSIMKAALA
jgi:chitinase